MTLVTISNWYKINISWSYFITLGDDITFVTNMLNFISLLVTILIINDTFVYILVTKFAVTKYWLKGDVINYRHILSVIRDDNIISSLLAFSDGANVTKVVTSIFSSQNSNGDVNLIFNDIIYASLICKFVVVCWQLTFRKSK